VSRPDREQVDQFVLEEYKHLLSAIRRKLNLDEIESLDLAHEAVMRIYDSLDKYDPEKGTLGMWFSGILRNLILQYREGRMRPYILNDDMEQAHGKKEGPQVGQTVSKEIGEFVLKSVESLPEIYREVVRLRYVDGLDLKAIAKKLKVPLGTVKARLSRAPNVLKGALQIQETTARFYLEQLARKKNP
jgi:RNA polymerase sigma-70 factor (ECF subfamily)